MKYALIGMIFLVIGYFLGTFLALDNDANSPTAVEISPETDESLESSDSMLVTPTEPISAKIESSEMVTIPTENTTIAEISDASSSDPLEKPNPSSPLTDANAPSEDFVEAGYLTESDFLRSPGEERNVGFRIGPPINAMKVDNIMANLPEDLLPLKVRFMTTSGRRLAVILGGSFIDKDMAYTYRASAQKNIKEGLEIIYLPTCIDKDSEDEQGFLCAPPEPEPEAESDENIAVSG